MFKSNDLRLMLARTFCFAMLLVCCLVQLSQAAAEDDVAHWIGRLATEQDKGFEALNRLVALGDDAVDPLRQLLRDTDENAQRRWQAAKALGAIGDRAAIDDLMHVLRETDSRTAVVRRVALEALLRMGDEKTKARLAEMAADEETQPALRSMVRSALDAKPIGSRIKKRLVDPEPPSIWQRQFEWADSHQQALQQAEREGKLVMTIVYANESSNPPLGSRDDAAIPFRILLRGPLADPDVHALLRRHFVTRKVALHIHQFSLDKKQPRPDPLLQLGTNTRDLQPPAILFHTSDGNLVERQNAIGVFNSRLTHAMLRHLLEESEIECDDRDLVALPDAIPPPLRDDWVEAKLQYLGGQTDAAIATVDRVVSSNDDKAANARFIAVAGVALHHDGQNAKAMQRFSQSLELGLQGDGLAEVLYWMLDCEPSPDAKRLLERAIVGEQNDWGEIWSAKLTQRRPDSDLDLAAAETFDVPADAATIFVRPPTPTLQQAVPRALQFLVETQSVHGDWRPLNQNYQIFTRAATAGICGTAIDKWLDDPLGVTISDELRQELEQAQASTLHTVQRYAEGLAQVKVERYEQVWNQTYLLEYVLHLLEQDRGNENLSKWGQQLVDLLLRHQYEEGGWSYLPPSSKDRWGGIRPHSFNTAPILIELVRAKRLGLKVDDDAIARAVTSLQSVRKPNGVFAYAPAPGFSWMNKHRAAIARDSLCELALNAGGEKNDAAIRNALGRFHTHRADLDIPRKLYSSYFNPNGHGSYFYAFGYFYASQGLTHLDAEQRQAYAADMQRDLLSTVETDGTWIDNHAQGKAYATAMVLRTLHNAARHGRPDDQR